MRPSEQRTLFAVTLRRPVAIFMVTTAVLVFGVFSYRLLPVELMPDISYPSLTVRTEYPGAAPAEVEENVTRPIEEALGVVNGLVRISSISRAGLSDVTLEFTWDTEMGEAWQEVNERLDTVFLPETAEKPLILRYDPSLDPVLRLTLSSSRPEDQSEAGLRRLRTFAEQELKRRLEQVEGVAAVRVLGGLEEQIRVELEEQALRRTGISIQEVVQRLAAENLNLAGGDIREGDTQYLVRTVNEFRTPEEIADLVVSRAGGRDIRVRDVGRVFSGWADRKVITRFNGHEAVEIEIQKEADANMVTMAAAVRQAVFGRADGGGGEEGAMTALLPEGWSLEVMSDRSRFIQAAVSEVKNAALIGGLLAVLVLYLFLGDFRATSVVSVAIPVSVAAAFAPMNLSGLSLNIMSLGGLALGIGMLVDSGIVVVESIARCREEGDPPGPAVVRGTAEVGGAVAASTLTTVAVFLPMVFVEGVAGEVFLDLALTVVFSLVASLLVAVFLIPALTGKVIAAGGGAGGSAPLGRRIQEALRFRSLGPVSEDGVASSHRWLHLLPLWPWLAGGALLGWWRGWTPAAVWVTAVGAASLVAAVVLVNFLLRLRRRRGLVGAAAALAGTLLDPVLLALESVWVGLLGAGMLVVLPAVLVARVAARALGFVLGPVAAAFSRAVAGLQALYPGAIRWALAHRSGVLLVSAASMALVVWGLVRLDTALIPDVHQGEFDVEMALPVGTPVDRTLRTVAPVEAAAIADPRVGRTLLKAGADPETDTDPQEGEHTARLTVHLREAAAGGGLLARWAGKLRDLWDAVAHLREGGVVAAREAAVIADLRRVTGTVPELEAKVTRPVLFSFRTPVEVEVEGFDLGQLRLMAERVRRELEAIPGLTDIKTSTRPGNPEVQIRYDREALVRLGLDIRTIAEIVRAKVQGEEATEYRRRERRVDVVVRLEEPDRSTLRKLQNLVVNPGEPVPIPLSSVAEIVVAEGPADIRRVGQRRVALVSANLDGRGLGAVSRDIEARLGAMAWPPGTDWRLAGQVQEMERSGRSLWLALGISIFLVYVVMASQFESFLHPLLIMVTVPLALLGVVAALHLLSIPLSVVVFLGMIMLAGIVVNNAIVYVDYVNTLRRRGMPVEAALAEAGRVRLRPILMTTATTVLGLLPMSLGLGDGAEIRTPMALTVIAGLVSSTLLTLVVLPTLYATAEAVLDRVRGAAPAPETPPGRPVSRGAS